MPKPKPQWEPVTEHPITEYRCGIRAGERVRLRQELVVRDHRGMPTRTHLPGEIWAVLSGSAEPPVDVWLRQPDGARHTWSDDDDFWIWFERVTDNAAS
jgi:hypothetical protein